MKLKIDRKLMPLLVTILVLIVGYAFGYSQYKGMRQPQAFFNIFIDNAFLLITSVGMTFVILSGGIDLSVGAVIALTTVASAHLLEMEGWSPGAVIPLMLLMGTALGAAMGSIIHFFQVQPFIVTLAGMFIARGTCFFISLTGVTISDPFYRQVALYQIPIPFFEKAFISINVVIALAVLVIAVYLAHFTRFGRTVYAIGGSEESALLMGLPVGRTKVLIYTLNGFLSALAGIVYSIYLLSGFGLNALNLEMDAIASVVIGGTLLEGGVGYVFGTMFGVLINGLIQNLIMFNGQLLSWWTRIAIGALTLVSLGLQSAFAVTRRRRVVVEKQARNNNKGAATEQK
jgi:ribose/xylose/arabinose/galactoside ABC-type transport system permease subunit